MQLKQFEEYLNSFLEAVNFNDYCPNGVQVEGKNTIRKAATAVSATLETIEKAVDENVDALIVHHGLFWNRDSYVVKGSKKAKLLQLLKNEISLLAYHLPLDAHTEVGNNWVAAKELGWTDLEVFSVGVKGKFPAIPLEEFRKKLEEYYQHDSATAFGGKKSVASAALISGGAYKELPNAAALGVDCFITGNFDEPAWGMAHEEKINFFALGHAATERIGPKSLALHLSKELKLSCHFIDIYNPF